MNSYELDFKAFGFFGILKHQGGPQQLGRSQQGSTMNRLSLRHGFAADVAVVVVMLSMMEMLQAGEAAQVSYFLDLVADCSIL